LEQLLLFCSKFFSFLCFENANLVFDSVRALFEIFTSVKYQAHHKGACSKFAPKGQQNTWNRLGTLEQKGIFNKKSLKTTVWHG
jgi:hypothetical protein